MKENEINPKTYEEQLKERVMQKINNEYDEFIKNLKTLTTDEIIDRAYEHVCKSEMIYVFENQDLSNNQMKALLKCPNILEDAYDRWIDADANFNEMLEYAVEDSINGITKEYTKSQNLKSR